MTGRNLSTVDLSGVPRLAAGTGRLEMTHLPTEGEAKDFRSADAPDAPDVFVLLVEDQELVEARAETLPAVITAGGIKVLRFPIADGGIPECRDALRTLLDDLLMRLVAGEHLVVACWGGLGRTGTIVGCLLRDGGLDGDAAISLTRASRPGTIENDRQEAFVRAWDWPPREVLA